MSSAGTANLTTSETLIFDANADGGKCTTFVVKNPSSSSVNALVRVEGLHKDTEYYSLIPGEKEYFRFNNNGIGKVYAKAASSTITGLMFGVVSKLTNV